jgi:hypothetical protein
MYSTGEAMADIKINIAAGRWLLLELLSLSINRLLRITEFKNPKITTKAYTTHL